MVWQEGGSRPLIGPSPLGVRLPSNASMMSSQVRLKPKTYRLRAAPVRHSPQAPVPSRGSVTHPAQLPPGARAAGAGLGPSRGLTLRHNNNVLPKPSFSSGPIA